uniref:Macaca fascicularis brain cDNA, clone: QflA-17795 n=1 Tax=Macaca fascicularis TaxID=9541 RepID=I7G5I2_MACFA|nr:unnamed protein product [Macaca fascicularis]
MIEFQEIIQKQNRANAFLFLKETATTIKTQHQYLKAFPKCKRSV